MPEQEKEQEQSGQSNADINRRLISADEARQLMVRSVRGLDSKLNEVSKIIQTTARRGETRAEVHSVQSSRSSLPIFDRIDNLGRVLLGSLRESGYDAKLREFRTADSCMLYIVADWSRAMEQKTEDPPAKPPELDAAKRKSAASERSKATEPASRKQKAAEPEADAAKSKRDKSNEDTNKDAEVKPSTDASSEATKPSESADGENSAAKPEDQARDASDDPETKEVKTKKFDRSKLLNISAVKKIAKSGNKLMPMVGGKAKTESELDPDITYSTEANGERIPIIFPVVMPSRMPLLQ